MFIAYQRDRIVAVAETQEGLFSPCLRITDIKEVPFAEMFNGVVYTDEEQLNQAKTKAVEETRANLYAQEVDPITAHINRLRDEELTIEVAAEIAKLVEERKVLVEEIKANNPYPVEPIENIEELPVVEEAVVSEIENTVEEID